MNIRKDCGKDCDTMKNLSLRILAVMLSLLFVFSSVCIAGAGENKAVGESAYTTEACSVESSGNINAKAIYSDYEWKVRSYMGIYDTEVKSGRKY